MCTCLRMYILQVIFPLCYVTCSALGTVAATYLTVAIVVRYYTRAVPEGHLSPLYNSGWAFDLNSIS